MDIVVKEGAICRANSAANGKNLGVVSGKFEVLDVVTKNEKTWLSIGDNKWVSKDDVSEFIDGDGESIEVPPDANSDESQLSPVESEELEVQLSDNSKNIDVVSEDSIEKATDSTESTDEQAKQDDHIQLASDLSEENQEEHTDEEDTSQISNSSPNDMDTDNKLSYNTCNISNDSDDILDKPGQLPSGGIGLCSIVRIKSNMHHPSCDSDISTEHRFKSHLAVVVDCVEGGKYPFKLHRINTASVLLKHGEMGYFSEEEIEPVEYM